MADLTVNNTTTVGTANAEPEQTPTTDASEATQAPADTAETAGDDTVATKDEKSWLGKLSEKVTDGAKLGYQQAWEHTARAQKRVNEQAKQPRDFFEKVGEKAGIDPREVREARAEAHGDDGEAHGAAHTVDHAFHVTHLGLHTAHGLDMAQSVVKNFGAINAVGGDIGAATGIVEHGEFTHGKLGGGILKWGGRAVFAFEAGKNAAAIYNDIMDADGLSIDSLQPIADTAASAAGTFGGPVGFSFKAGYDFGKWLDDKVGIGKAIDEAHDRSITQHTQIGFLCDRAREMDLAAAYRIQTGTHTRRDVIRARSIVREAREHGILGADGRVDELALRSMLYSGDRADARRIANGIERAALLEQRWGLEER